ncbi:serine hydrolase [Labilibacter sediminis]|nr:serine hydrolase [Labilibacter sediminis]
MKIRNKILWICTAFCLTTQFVVSQSGSSDGVAEENAIVTARSKTKTADKKDFNLRTNYQYSQPENLKDGIKVGNIKNVHVDASAIFSLIRNIEQNNLAWFQNATGSNVKKGCVDSFLLFKDGKLVVEEYFADAARDKMHFQMSITKSVTALAMGVMLDHGYVKNVNETAITYLPEVDLSKVPAEVANIKIKDLLSMQSGIRVNDTYKAPNNVQIDKRIPQILENCTMVKPGTEYKYQGVDPEIVSHIIYNVSGKTVEEIVEQYLFSPMGISPYKFDSSSCGLTKTAAGMALRSRDMLKLGMLNINQGMWINKEIVSSGWIEQINTSVVDNGRHQYGYFWWQHKVNYKGKRYEVKSCRGAFGQFIFIIPELNAITVFTSYGTRNPFKYLEETIIPAMAG